jgi:hypothetical protein
MGCQDVQAVPRPFGPGAPHFAPHASNRLQFTNLTHAVPSHLIVGLDLASVRVHAGSSGASQALAAHRRRRSPCRHVRSVWLPTSALSGMPGHRVGGERPRTSVRDCPRECTWRRMRCYSLWYAGASVIAGFRPTHYESPDWRPGRFDDHGLSARLSITVRLSARVRLAARLAVKARQPGRNETCRQDRGLTKC